jgi:hypothetical protein
MPRAEMNSIKLGVRQIAATGKPFTITDLQRRTGFNVESIRTEVQRLRQEGLIVTTAVAEREVNQRGAPSSIYCLAKDESRVATLRKSIEEFYAQAPLMRTDEPTSTHFAATVAAIDKALALYGGPRVEELLQQAEEELESARYAEGDENASERLRARLDFEGARIQFARAKYSEALGEFSRLGGILSRCKDHAAARVAKDYMLAAELHGSDREEAGIPWELSRTAETLRERWQDIVSPVSQFMVDVMKRGASRQKEQCEPGGAKQDYEYVGSRVADDEFESLTGHKLQECAAPLA